ncbi:sigma-70 family RNA polymerase sigma factor [Arthrobacter roseus]|uniref:sigma-70 family RNA polymerase sigma factor n=1 Tax=Arthrobacter roseus TaxID=136274 RepID=UPI001964DCB7|nr:sigma-70 family RNA polymerase sigma factor [Arthrobacter roseus]MBM7847187.1 RNA polymerase sigma-B factor [Arthrobacter roseus]
MLTISPCADNLVLGHLDLARSVARSFSVTGPDSPDILQVAYLGLVKASHRYDADFGVPFPAYAVPTMAGEIKRYLRDSCWMVRPPRTVQDLRTEAARASSALAQKLGREPSLDELSEQLDEHPDAVAEAMNCQSSMRPDSLDALAGDSSWADRLCAADSSMDRRDEVLSLRAAVAELSAKEKELLFRRFYCEESQQRVGERLGMSQMQVSRLLARTLVRLQKCLSDAPGQDATTK